MNSINPNLIFAGQLPVMTYTRSRSQPWYQLTDLYGNVFYFDIEPRPVQHPPESFELELMAFQASRQPPRTIFINAGDFSHRLRFMRDYCRAKGLHLVEMTPRQFTDECFHWLETPSELASYTNLAPTPVNKIDPQAPKKLTPLPADFNCKDAWL